MQSSASIGQAAEQNVANHLAKLGYQIMAHNWRRPRCELDIIARKNGIIYFVEVKYRVSDVQGEGFDYITVSKQKQLEFGARLWCAENNYEGDWRLLAASVTGPMFDQIKTVEI